MKSEFIQISARKKTNWDNSAKIQICRTSKASEISQRFKKNSTLYIFRNFRRFENQQFFDAIKGHHFGKAENKKQI